MEFFLIDAFAERAFTGNPAAVVWIEGEWPEDEWLGKLAMEFNQAETAYVRGRADGGFDLRWFTPAREVVLCGHATLASAKALIEWKKANQGEAIRFVTQWSGELSCTVRGDQIAMDFPATPPAPAALPVDVAKVLGAGGPVQCVGTVPMNLTLRLRDASEVRRARPDLKTLANWHPIGVTITAPGDQAGVDFVSRFFAPAAGVDEDPVTGSAHCSLAVYWAGELGKSEFVAKQLSRRGGTVGVKLMGDRVELRGGAVVTASGRVYA